MVLIALGSYISTPFYVVKDCGLISDARIAVRVAFVLKLALQERIAPISVCTGRA
jgi:hypothetical protein